MIGRPGMLARTLIAGFAVLVSMLVGCSAVSDNLSDAEAAIPPPAAAADRGGGGGSADAPGAINQAGNAELLVEVRPTVEIPTEWGSEIEELYGRYWLYWEAFAAAHGPPNADPGYKPLRDLSTTRNWESLADQLRGFAADGLLLSLPQASITEHLLRIPNASVLSTNEGDEVVLQDCWIDDFTQRTLAGHIVNQAKEAKLMNVTMKVEDGTWRVDGITHAAPDSDGYEQCADLISS